MSSFPPLNFVRKIIKANYMITSQLQASEMHKFAKCIFCQTFQIIYKLRIVLLGNTSFTVNIYFQQHIRLVHCYTLDDAVRIVCRCEDGSWKIFSGLKPVVQPVQQVSVWRHCLCTSSFLLPFSADNYFSWTFLSRLHFSTPRMCGDGRMVVFDSSQWFLSL